MEPEDRFNVHHNNHTGRQCDMMHVQLNILTGYDIICTCPFATLYGEPMKFCIQETNHCVSWTPNRVLNSQ